MSNPTICQKKKRGRPPKSSSANHTAAKPDSRTSSQEDPNCPICKKEVLDSQQGLMCKRCQVWSHRMCLDIPVEEYFILENSSEDWYCVSCQLIRASNIKWGDMEGEDNIWDFIRDAYNEITKWRKNLFTLPRGKSGTEFIKELSRLISLFTHKTSWQHLAIPFSVIFVPIMLQKPVPKSKACDNAKFLLSRLERWKNGDVKSLMSEVRTIQSRLAKSRIMESESNGKGFCRLMLEGKDSQAMKFINFDDSIKGVHKLSKEVIDILSSKHPKSEIPPSEILLPETALVSEPVIFEVITAELIEKVAKSVNGSGGSTLVDADAWKHFLCSFGKTSYELCQTIAELARILCTEDVNQVCLSHFVACRLVPLDKGEDNDGKPGVRPIGIGEVMRRIVGKAVTWINKDDIQEAAGPLQTCAGLKSGIEAMIHTMKRCFDEDNTEALLMVDADNAFNRLNRVAALHNIKQICPTFHQYLKNTYQSSAKLIINDNEKGGVLKSDEGCTQGDVCAMAKYALGVRPLITGLGEKIKAQECKQGWYADDSSAVGRLMEIRKWWDELCKNGPKYGYFPKPSKTILIVKNEVNLQKAKDIFTGTGIIILLDGQRNLGAVIGSLEYREKYVKGKIDNWIKDVEEISEIAKEEPQCAYAAYTRALCHRWTFIQRTIPNISHLFSPLETVLREKLIPAIFGRNVSDLERRILSLPVRYGGLGIINPVISADREYSASVAVTENLCRLIYNQEQTLEKMGKDRISATLDTIKTAKELHFENEFEDILSEVDSKMKRDLKLSREKGSGCWLTALPLKSKGYSLNKQEFRDSIYLRYDWKIPNTPAYCSCGIRNDVNHTLTCKLGGYVIWRHNFLRDTEADLLRETCKDVRIEPDLIPIESDDFRVSNGNNADNARLDISARGVWSPFERSFFDVRVVHPNAPSYISKSIEQVYTHHEKEKKRLYNNRVLQVEKGSFTPLIFSTSGGMAPEATRYHKRLGELIAEKRGVRFADVISYIRTRLRFALLRSVLVAVRGIRGKKSTRDIISVSQTSFNIIPNSDQYECP